MADHADNADGLIEATVNMRVARIRQQAQASKRSDTDTSDCEECGFEVPEARLALGYSTCIECQTALEAFNKHRRRA